MRNIECLNCYEVKPTSDFFPTNLTQCRECLGRKRLERIAKDPVKHAALQRANSARYRRKLAKKHLEGTK